MEAQEYKIRIELSGKINGAEFNGKGEATGDPALGNPSVSINFSRIPGGPGPFGNFIAVINMLSLTLSKQVAPAKNFLNLTDGNFQFARSVEGAGINVRSNGSMKRLGPRELVLSAGIEGSITFAETAPGEPRSLSVDSWEGIQVPAGPGSVIETMIVKLGFSGTGKKTTVYVVTHYTFDMEKTLPAVQIRHIEVEGKEEDAQRLTAKFRATITPTSSSVGLAAAG